MVRIAPHSRSRSARSRLIIRLLGWSLTFTAIAFVLSLIVASKSGSHSVRDLEREAERDFGLLRQRVAATAEHMQVITTPGVDTTTTNAGSGATCPYMALTDLTADERYPTASSQRHMVTPPQDTETAGVTLVCCETTKGPWNILVHHNWAPIGARRFLDMVEAAYFETTVPLMRCVDKFLCQFGLNGVPSAMKPFLRPLPDDPNWLPEGKDHRQNDLGVRRFQKGYMAYAGAGPNSRNLQFIVGLVDNGPLAGGSPWEVPWGELVGPHSFETLSKVYTGYGEKGPKQGLLHKSSALSFVKKHFSELDYVTTCRVVDRSGGQGEPGSTKSDAS